MYSFGGGGQASEFVYNTGRSWESARKVMEELKHVPMLTPRAVIASVGTEVCVRVSAPPKYIL